MTDTLLHSHDEEIPKYMDTIKEDFEDIFTCGICQNMLSTPVTLMCQHTFCKNCIIEVANTSTVLYPRCPICDKPFFMIELDGKNGMIESAVDLVRATYFTEDEMEEHKMDQEKEKLSLELRQEVIKELTRELIGENVIQPFPHFISGEEDIEDDDMAPCPCPKRTPWQLFTGMFTGHYKSEALARGLTTMSLLAMTTVGTVGLGVKVYKMLKE